MKPYRGFVQWLARWPATHRVAHWSPWLMVGVAVGFFPLGMFRWYAEWPGAIASITLAAIDGAVWLAAQAHESRMCLLCVQRMPLDTEEAVRKQDFFLRVRHNQSRLWRRASWTLVAILALSLVFTLSAIMPTIFSRVVLGVFLASGAVLLQSQVVHVILQPWCPYCRRRWKDRGPREVAPVPPPTGVVTPQ